MAYVLDIAVILIFGLMVYFGHRDGFIKTVAGMIAFVVALVLSSVLAGPVSDLAYDKLVEPPVVTALEESVGDDSLAADGLTTAIEKMPGFVKSQLATQGIHDGADLLQYVNNAEKGESAVDSVMSKVIEPVTVPVLKAVCSLLLFFLFQLIISLILKLLNVLAKLPVLKQANKTLGIVAGVVQGALWALLIATILQAVAATGLIPMVSEELLDSTILVKWLSSINPLHTYMQEIFTVTA
ncbi:MAG: CvpA family protein [Clostridia bacterium]|nr:CvpA family protein [Clostridia bacterium]